MSNKKSVTAVQKLKKLTLENVLPYILLVGGIIGLICSFIITYDKMRLLEDPNFVPNCNLNPIISCGSVMQSKQGSAFGFPNPWIGLAAFAVLVTVGVVLLASAKFKRWFWLGLEFGTILGLGFVHWLFFESVYRIHSLCPYCIAVWVVTITTFWYVTLYNIQQNYISVPGRLIGIADFMRRHHLDILLLWFIVIAALILKHFWYYYGKYL
jgi:uncharacterized membrane protein